MRFAYMDEAGNTGRKLDDAKQPVHLILSVVIDEEKIPLVHEHIRKMGRRHCVVADEAKEVEDTALRDLANYQEVGTSWGWNPEQIDHIVDTIHFVPSHSNGAIQLTDCATYIAARVRKIRAGTVPSGRSAQAIEELWETRIDPHIWHDSVWHPG
ncbi:MAG TPA: DUF3800 domain-containing protein [Solirubrobacterales bacterium]|jgi:hypothetical protein|nr:DUF3800 domain-containing protein [Solirubrobacterales bacterium]